MAVAVEGEERYRLRVFEIGIGIVRKYVRFLG